MSYTTVIHVPEGTKVPGTPIAARFNENLELFRIYILDEKLAPIRVYNSRGERVRRTNIQDDWAEGVFITVGWTAAEVAASYLNAIYVHERAARSIAEHSVQPQLSLLKAAALLGLGRVSPKDVEAGIVLIVLPGNLSSIGAWGIAVVAEVKSGFKLLARIHFQENLSVVLEDIRDYELFDRYGNWWEIPYEAIVAVGKGLKRRIEFLTERPVARIPPNTFTELSKTGSDVKVAMGLIDWLSELELPYRSYRSINKAVVYLGKEYVEGNYEAVGIYIQKNVFRRIKSRWYFSSNMHIIGYDNGPPEAAGEVDIKLIAGDIEGVKGLKVPRALLPIAMDFARKTVVRLNDYLAVKLVRWYEVAEL